MVLRTPSNSVGEWFFSAPHEPIVNRRGDPLGFRARADSYADVLAPGLSNRTVDARWLSILSWILVQTDEALQRHGRAEKGDEPLTRAQGRAVYEFVRPLELMWIARTLEQDGGTRGRQLPGRLSVQRFVEDPRRYRFGLSRDQESRYRAAGPYGAYRVALRSLPLLTRSGDGWRPGAIGQKLAAVVSEATPDPDHAPAGARGKRPSPDAYWTKRWVRWRERRRGKTPILPLRFRIERLAGEEAKLLRKVLFEKDLLGERRLVVAQAIANRPSHEHSAILAVIVRALRGIGVPDSLRSLVEFSDLADGGVAALDAIWDAARPRPAASLGDIARDSDVDAQMDELIHAATAFDELRTRDPESEVAEALVRALLGAKTRQARVSALIEHHLHQGGGRRWFHRSGDEIERAIPDRGTETSEYRFRLRPLEYLAWQVRAIDTKPASASKGVVANEEEDQGE